MLNRFDRTILAVYELGETARDHACLSPVRLDRDSRGLHKAACRAVYAGHLGVETPIQVPLEERPTPEDPLGDVEIHDRCDQQRAAPNVQTVN